MYYTLEVYMQEPPKEKFKLEGADANGILESAAKGAKGLGDAMANPGAAIADAFGDKKGEAYIKLEKEMIKSVQVHTVTEKNVIKDAQGNDVDAVYAPFVRENIKIEVTGYLYKPNDVYEDTARLLFWAHHAPHVEGVSQYKAMFDRLEDYAKLSKEAEKADYKNSHQDKKIDIDNFEKAKKAWQTSESGTFGDEDWFEKIDSGYRHVILRIHAADVESVVTFGGKEDYRLVYLPSAYISSYKETYDIRSGNALFSMIIQQNPDETYGVRILSQKKDSVGLLGKLQTGIGKIAKAGKGVAAIAGAGAAVAGTVKLGMHMDAVRKADDVEKARKKYEEAKAKAGLDSKYEAYQKALADEEKARKAGTLTDDIIAATAAAKADYDAAINACKNEKEAYDKAKSSYEAATKREKITSKVTSGISSAGGIAAADSAKTIIRNVDVLDQAVDTKRQNRDKDYSASEKVRMSQIEKESTAEANKARYQKLKDT